MPRHIEGATVVPAPPFRLRAHGVSRLEGFSDAVFGFALTLLVVSLQPPRTFDELSDALGGLVPFAICFALFLQIWLEHRRFFRRYALDDGWTVLLNSVLLFVVLAYVYPLKFLFTLLGWEFVGVVPAALRDLVVIRPGQLSTLMYVYAAGFAAIAITFALLYANALRQAEVLALTPLERHDTVTELLAQGVLVAVAAASAALVAAGARVAWAGLVYCLIGPAMGLLHARRGAARRRLWDRLAAEGPVSASRPTPAGAG
ncbi:MAG: TMEM175 family protein [Anaeromyxobacteraceae bacterium]